jgi:hypothetical protein
LFDERVAELTPVWKQILKDSEESRSHAKARHEAAKSRFEDAKKAEDKAKEAMGKEKEKALEEEFKHLEEARKAAESAEYSWKNELDRLSDLVDKNTVKNQQKAWEEKEAYMADGFKLVANTGLCLSCHQVGILQPNQRLTEGPPLNLAAERLRPGWLKRWIASPQRYLTYETVMPNNFPSDRVGQLQQWFAGTSLEQSTAVRDVLMAYPRAVALPVNRYWALPIADDKKAAESKKGDKK